MLNIDKKQMKNMGYQVVDLIVEHFASIAQKKVTTVQGKSELEMLFAEDLPEDAMNFTELLAKVEKDVFANIMHVDSPRFFAYIPGPTNFISVLADFLASGFNPYSGTWLEACGPTMVELQTVKWFCQAFALGDKAGGIFLSGGSMGNLTGLYLAREEFAKGKMQDALIYCSDQTHSSVAKAAKIIGIYPEQIRKIAVDKCYKIEIELLQKQIAADQKQNRIPIAIVANAGSTNTGAVDDFFALSQIAKSHKMWLHVDGAYGGAAILSRKGQQNLPNIHLADSISLDPHKWLFQPYESSIFLTQDVAKLKQHFSVRPEYLTELDGANIDVNLCDYGPQLTRSFKALKVWMTLKFWGKEKIAQAIDWGFELAEYAALQIEAAKNLELFIKGNMAIVCFRPKNKNVKPSAIVDAIIQNGYGMISSTTLHAQEVLRICTINPHTTKEEIQKIVEMCDSLCAVK